MYGASMFVAAGVMQREDRGYTVGMRVMRTEYGLMTLVNVGWILTAEGADVLVCTTGVWISCLWVAVPSIANTYWVRVNTR